MTTIGIINFHRSFNYGAVLQSYALQKTLETMGYAPEIIDYTSPLRGYSSLPLLRKPVHVLWNSILKKIIAGRKREEKTNQFRKEYFQLSSQKYFDQKSLYLAKYDAYITGSDQVWNPDLIKNDSSYFLTFAPPGRKRISYAASFGVSKIKTEHFAEYSRWLQQIDFLSTREAEGKDIIKQLTGRDSVIVLDPTLLLSKEQWKEVMTPFPAKRPFILCYYMPGDRIVNMGITKLALEVSRLTGWDIVRIGQKEYMHLVPWIHSVFDAGPSEFLGLFQNASFVITNSFHGTAFSINFKKPFLVPVNRNLPSEKSLISRIATLLGSLNLKTKIIEMDEEAQIKLEDDFLEINSKDVEKRLSEEKQRSISFLKDALGG